MLTSERPRAAGASLWPAALILWGSGSRSTPHSHHCIQVYLALSGTVRARSDPSTRWRRCAAVLIAPDVRHEIDASGSPVLIGFFDPESEFAASLEAPAPGEITFVPGVVAARWREILGEPAEIDKACVDRWVQSSLLREQRPRALHPAVRRALDRLRNGGLHERQSLGIPFRAYVRWLRVQRAMGALHAGCGITEAAQVAGFSDAAHLTRTLRQTLGQTPGELVRRCVLRGDMHRTTLR